MKKRPFVLICLSLISVTFLLLATGCKKDDDGTSVTDIDGNKYHTVTIGTQTWLKENLKTTRLNDGTPLLNEIGDAAWEAMTTYGYCWYDNDAAVKGKTYGALYNFAVANSGKICPSGWHVPTSAEWTVLKNYVGNDDDAGGKLKEAGTSHWNSPNTGANDDYGFTALAAGQRYEDGPYIYLGKNCNFWTTTIGPGTNPYGIRLYHDGADYHMSEFHRNRGLSIRCIKD